jgi:hypothetical protein
LADLKTCLKKRYATYLPEKHVRTGNGLPTSPSLRSDILGFGKRRRLLTKEDEPVTIGKQEPGNREIMEIKAAANYLAVSRSHLAHILAGKVAGVPAIPHVRAGRPALMRRAVIDDWLLQQEHGPAVGVAR